MVRVTPLNAEDRREEVAQLAGGHSAQEAIAFADSLLAQAATLRATGPGEREALPAATAASAAAPAEAPAPKPSATADGTAAALQLDIPPQAAKRARKTPRHSQG